MADGKQRQQCKTRRKSHVEVLKGSLLLVLAGTGGRPHSPCPACLAGCCLPGALSPLQVRGVEEQRGCAAAAGTYQGLWPGELLGAQPAFAPKPLRCYKNQWYLMLLRLCFLVRTQGDSTTQYPRVLSADTEPSAAKVPEAHRCPLGGDSIPHVPGDAE